jgi:hypothetical protein
VAAAKVAVVDGGYAVDPDSTLRPAPPPDNGHIDLTWFWIEEAP